MEKIHYARKTGLGFLMAALVAATAAAQIPNSAYSVRRAAALAAIRGDRLIASEMAVRSIP